MTTSARLVPWPIFSPVFQRQSRIVWTSYLVAPKEELEQDLGWARSRRTEGVCDHEEATDYRS
eukprot:11189506-Lingulodinium_polyedra.AAC.1